MTGELVMILGLLVVALVLFALGRPRMDAVALMLVAVLPFTGVVSVPEALSGFSDPSVILIAALFVIGDALVRTGVAQWIGDRMVRAAGGRETRLIAFLMLAAAGLSAVMSSTGVVAIFVPIVLRIARAARVAVGRLMMPLSMAALISGMLTLVATPPNMVVNAALVREGHEGFGFFAFTPFGLPILVLAILYMLAVRGWLTRGEDAPPPRRLRMRDLAASYAPDGRLARLQVGAGSVLAGQSLDALDLPARAGITVVAIERRGRLGAELVEPVAATRLQAQDILWLGVVGEGFDAAAFAAGNGLNLLPLRGRDLARPGREYGLVEAMVPPGSAFAGRSPAAARMREVLGVSVIAVRRGQEVLPGPAPDNALREGDTLLLAGPWRVIRPLAGQRRDLVLLDLPEEAEEFVPERRRAPIAVAVLLGVVAAMATGVVPNAQAALLGCLALGLFGVMDTRSGYRAISWQTLVLIAGMMPFALALQRTGGVDLVANAALELIGPGEPRLLLAALFIATTTLSLFISNTATAVLMAPVALAIAQGLGASPYPFAMCVALAASTAFMTPVSSPVNLLVLAPGGYRFMDFVRIGTPFTLVTLVVSVTLLPILLPLGIAP
ncbi:SLC13 family permease [Rhodovulum sp.]|uniref:SLC13 family permease n=1 Tax=Rhodovulum sp. TaxID=34009 RepID=UPI0017F31278|nr:SLC13 family permease [Rhodovulum sp.]HDR28927.1 TRAP transporter large permease subunit [Rhodovulum sp.]